MNALWSDVGLVVSAGTTLVYGALGGIVSERSGVINLGAEGIMLMGAASAYLTDVQTGNVWLALAAALLSGILFGMLHGFLTVTLRANQILSGLGVSLFGNGLSAYVGNSVVGVPLSVSVPSVFHVNLMVWLSWAMALILVIWFYRTRWGMGLRALGDSPAAADAMGLPVSALRYGYVILGCVLMALGGAYLSLVYSPQWVQGMTAGVGWIAIALVVFARWQPLRAVFGAYLFGGLNALNFRLQLAGSHVASEFLNMMPYVLTILVLIVVRWMSRGKPTGQPLALGTPYIREERQ
ncbi:ABC transporter permease [Alicyclobacillus cellulosilyticus]|uniref:ABC transporter permease n=1 Tax=Alicyclobacillus cellulosilyticus TaxID=1003997 RepID=A0A917KJ21_9BACL|nr:ABC transporter permease [Alicyclobacillus cellulosilyticus]GGJ13304.1 ABC transporter permease [Alicyclobacillus cellulosilyticus]